MKKVLCMLLALVMLSGLAACGSSAPAPTEQPAPAAEEPAEEPVAEEPEEEVIPEVTYRVSVEDPAGYPVPGVTVELCDDTVCFKGETDENGDAEFTARDVACTVKVLNAPENFGFTEEEFTFPDNGKELCITLEVLEEETAKDMLGNTIPLTFRFQPRDLDGNPVRLGDIVSGYKVTMLNFWETGCKPCVKEMPALEELNVKFKEQDCQIVGVCLVWGSTDSNSESVVKAKSILESKGVTYPTLIAQELDAGMPGISAYPTTFFIDGRGRVLTMTIGAPTDVEGVYSDYLEYALSVLEGLAAEGSEAEESAEG